MSPRNEEQNAMIKDERREQILSAALRVFATKGFTAAKIGDIVSRAGMSHGLVYHYFKSKEELFYALLQRAMHESAHSLQLVESLPISAIEKVRQTARYIMGGIENFEESAYYFLIVVQASVMEGPDERKYEIMRGSEYAMASMVHILEEGQKSGDVRRGNPLDMAMAFFAAIQGLAIYKLGIAGFRMPDPEILVNIVKN